MKKEFIPYEQALELKELGFDEECIAFYPHKDYSLQIEELGISFNDVEKSFEMVIGVPCLAPLYQQAFRWFREKYGIVPVIYKGTHFYNWFIKSKSFVGEEFDFDTYEEAELACLKKLIEIAKNK